MRKWQAALEKLSEALQVCGKISMKMKIGNASGSCCFSVVASYYHSIYKEEDVKSVEHGLLVRKPCISCLVSPDDVKEMQMASCPTIQYCKSARELFIECIADFISTN